MGIICIDLSERPLIKWRGNQLFGVLEWGEKLSPCNIDGSSNMKTILGEHIENLQNFHAMLPFKYVLAFELNSFTYG